MTRETKVGLLVGMGVILLIGIIVSDQLSSIQHQDAADLTDFAGQSQQSIAPLGAAEPRVDNAADTGAQVLTPPGSTTPAIEQAESDFDAPPINPLREARRGESFVEQMALRTDASQPAPPVINGTPATSTVTETIIPLNTDRGVPTMALDQTRQPTPLSQPPAAAVKTVTHTVVLGDSLYRISEKYLGNGADWKKIVDANPGKVTSDGQVQTGVVLTIPAAPASEVAQVQSPVVPTTTLAAQPETRNLKPETRTAKTYTVRAGDSLYRIAEKHLGNGADWKKIAAANPGKVTRDGQVQTGVTLTIP